MEPDDHKHPARPPIPVMVLGAIAALMCVAAILVDVLRG